MEVVPALPIELWRAVCTVNVISAEFPYVDSGAYSVLVRVARRFVIPNAKALFIRKVSIGGGFQTALPNGHLHSIEDRPAYVFYDDKHWYKDNVLHRVGLPAVIYSMGTRVWCTEGKRRRELPFIIYNDGSQCFAEDDETVFGNCTKIWWRLLKTGKTTAIDLHANKCLYINGKNRTPPCDDLGYFQKWNCPRPGGLPSLITNLGTQRWQTPAANDKRWAQVLTAAEVMDIYRGWIDDWHARGMFLDISLDSLRVGGMVMA